jgi:homoserine kinase
MSPGTVVRVRVPATSANLGPGYDALGLALSLFDDVVVRVEGDGAPPVTLHVEGEGETDLPRDASHLVVRALHATLEALGAPRPNLTLWCTNRIPHGRGLGSSAAAAVTGVLAGRALAGAGRDDGSELAAAAALEGHPDNAAACLLGGLTIAWGEGVDVRAVRTEPSPGVRAVVLVPPGALSTETARGLLPASVPHGDAAHSAGRAALLVEALTRRPDLLLAATEDRLHQGYRAAAMPETAALLAELRAAGDAAVVSGAGPSVLVLTTDGDVLVDAPAGWVRHDLTAGAAGASVELTKD